MNRSFIIIITILICFTTQAQVKNANTYYFNRELREQMASFAINPAYIFYLPDSSYSDVSLQWNSMQNKGLYEVQEGNNFTDRRFDAHALRLNSKNAIYGQASYQNGYTEAIKWNTTADGDLRYPYVVADTIGGTSYREYYTFLGGYVRQVGRFTLGGEANYRSGLTFRKVDPRPKNTISDLALMVGASLPIASHRLGFNMGIQNYKQSQRIDIYRPGSGVKLFYLRGLGISDTGFSTVITNNSGSTNYYDTFAKTFALQLYPESSRGMYYSLHYRSSSMELSNGDNDLVHRLEKRVYKTEIGHQAVRSNYILNLKAFAAAHLHDGYEYNYDRGRKLISIASKYGQQNLVAGVSGIYTSKITPTNRFFVLASIQWAMDSEEYRTPSSEPKAMQEYTMLNPGITVGIDKQWAKSYLSFKLETTYFACLDKKLQTSRMAAHRANETLIIPNFNYLTNNKWLWNPSLRYSREVTTKTDLYMQAEYLHINFENGKPVEGFNLAVGFMM